MNKNYMSYKFQVLLHSLYSQDKITDNLLDDYKNKKILNNINYNLC